MTLGWRKDNYYDGCALWVSDVDGLVESTELVFFFRSDKSVDEFDPAAEILKSGRLVGGLQLDDQAPARCSVMSYSEVVLVDLLHCLQEMLNMREVKVTHP